MNRTHLGVAAADGTRPFIDARAFVWDGQALAASSGLNHEGAVLWRQQYVPGPHGLDDAPQVRVEKDLLGSPSTATYALLRDEMGTVVGMAEDAQPTAQGQPPRLLARYLSSPYGEAHVELGPELVEIHFDEATTKVGTTSQNLTPNQTVGGALRIVTTTPLAASSLATGLTIEQYDQASSSWQAAPRTDFAIGPATEDPATTLVMRLAGWPKGERFRITLNPGLADSFGRLLRLPPGEASGVKVELPVPSDGTTPPSFERKFAITRDPEAAAQTLGGAFPGGQTSGFQGAWSDPVTGLGFHRARWLDRANASWLSPDPEGAVDSDDLYAVFARSPQMRGDPLGLFDVGIHQEITTEAAQESGIFSAGDSRSSPTLDAINHGHIVADNPLGPYASIDAQHFDNSQFEAGIALRRQLLREFNSVSDPMKAAELFGRYLHATHDFYAHSSYVEILVFGKYSGVAPPDLPLWDFRSPPAGEFEGMISGRYGFFSGQACRFLGAGCSLPGEEPGHYGPRGFSINKDNNGTPEGSIKAPCGMTYFEIARLLAKRQTILEFQANAERLREIDRIIRHDVAMRARAAQERLEARRKRGWRGP